ncbi:MAG: ATP-dependent helicase [Myxococcales bacterium]|nr:ATP-dependent helicase [Myxococcales bacterium]
MLFRSVAKDSAPLVAELRRRNVPFLVKGLNQLFESPEIKAVVGIFRFMVAEITAEDLKAQWKDAELIPSAGDWKKAFAVLENGRDFATDRRIRSSTSSASTLDFLEALGAARRHVPGDASRGELVFYQLGKFSQVISDYEQIHFTTEPKAKYEGFARWLEHQAPGQYADADADVGYASPDAVTIATVHQSKGLQWPAVFLPALRRNRFPSRVMGGVQLHHVIPDDALDDPARYRGTVEDETRLLYVAVTRAQKYLYASFAPLADNQQQRNRSEFFEHIAQQQWVSTTPSPIPGERLPPQPLQETPRVTLSFSELKYLFECSYQFKLRFLYGFNAPIHEALGYGKGLHDALSEVHKQALEGDMVTKASPLRSSTDTSTRPTRTTPSASSCALPVSRPSSATSTPTARRSRTPSSPRSRSRSTSRRASRSTVASTSSAASTPERSPSSTSSPASARRQRTSPGTNSTFTRSATRS